MRRLFELEVPEIFEGIVEIKSIARDPGERTKIAVYSKDDKVDCVGACVGMRGSRVKNIVSELHGEKIDIVRYSSDMKEYIQAALSPAEISQIQVISLDKRANIIVADDQLSLAIGKHGQNVRLASRLLGWELNIFSPDQWKQSHEELLKIRDSQESSGDETKSAQDKTESGLENLSGVGEKMLEHLKEAGFDTLAKIADASVEDLTNVKGLGEVKATKIIKDAKKLLKA